MEQPQRRSRRLEQLQRERERERARKEGPRPKTRARTVAESVQAQPMDIDGKTWDDHFQELVDLGKTDWKGRREWAFEDYIGRIRDARNINESDGWTLLTYALKYKSATDDLLLKIVEFPDFDPTLPDYDVLVTKAMQNQPSFLGSLFNVTNVDVNRVVEYSGYTALHYAAGDDEPIEKMALLLNHPQIDVNKQSENKQKITPLMRAIQYNQKDKVDLLLDTGKVEINLQDSDGKTALMYAVKGHKNNIANRLLQVSDIDIAIKNRVGDALTFAIFAENKEMIQKLSQLLPGKIDRDLQNFITLVQLEKQPEKLEHFFNTNDAFLQESHLAQLLNDGDDDDDDDDDEDDDFYTKVKNFVENHPRIVYKRNKYGQTALHLAINSISTKDKVLLFLIKKGSNVNASDEDGRTPLHYALGQETVSKNVLRKMHRNGADPNIRDSLGNTPFAYACESGSKKHIKFFLKQPDLNVNVKNNLNITPLSLFCSSRNIKNIRLLRSIVNKGLVNDKIYDPKDFYGNTLFSIIFKRRLGDKLKPICMLLIEKGATLDDINEMNDSILHGLLALWVQQHNEISWDDWKLLFTETSNFANHKNKKGDTPLLFYLKNGGKNKKLLQLLLNQGANLNALDNDGNNILHITSKDIDLFNWFINKGIQKNIPNKNGFTPLQLLFIRYGNIVQLFTEQAKINAQMPDNVENSEILYRAMANNNNYLIGKYLQRSNPNYIDKNGNNFLMVAKKYGLLEQFQKTPQAQNLLNQTQNGYLYKWGLGIEFETDMYSPKIYMFNKNVLKAKMDFPKQILWNLTSPEIPVKKSWGYLGPFKTKLGIVEPDYNENGKYNELVTNRWEYATVGSITNDMRKFKRQFQDHLRAKGKEFVYPKFGNDVFIKKGNSHLYRYKTLTNGSYHINITLPLPHKSLGFVRVPDETALLKFHEFYHQNCMIGLQWLEPIIMGCYCSADIFSAGDEGNFSEMSYRILVNEYSKFGTSDPNKFKKLDDRGATRTPNDLSVLAGRLEQLFSGDVRPYTFEKGADFRRDSEKGKYFGFEFRILDLFPLEDMEQLLRFLVLLFDHIVVHSRTKPFRPVAYKTDGFWIENILVPIIKEGSNAFLQRTDLEQLLETLQMPKTLIKTVDMTCWEFMNLLNDWLWEEYGQKGMITQIMGTDANRQPYTTKPKLRNVSRASWDHILDSIYNQPNSPFRQKMADFYNFLKENNITSDLYRPSAPRRDATKRKVNSWLRDNGLEKFIKEDIPDLLLYVQGKEEQMYQRKYLKYKQKYLHLLQC